jgi:hypothetical protein
MFTVFYPNRSNKDTYTYRCGYFANTVKEYSFSTIEEYFKNEHNNFELKVVEVSDLNSLFAEGYVLFPVNKTPYSEVLLYKKKGFKPVYIKAADFQKVKKLLKTFD